MVFPFWTHRRFDVMLKRLADRQIQPKQSARTLFKRLCGGLMWMVCMAATFSQAEVHTARAASYSEPSSSHNHSSTDAPIQVTDFLGRTVTLEKPAQRIVALAPHIVENLYSAGAGSAIVGAVDYCNYPEAAKKIPRVGAISAFSLEAIVALKPDLVVVWHSGLGGKVLPKLEKLGLTLYASDPTTLQDIPKAIRDYGVLTGNSATANVAASEFESRHQQLVTRYQHQKRLDVFYQVWNQPLQTLNREHIISDLIQLCGGNNVFGDAAAIAPTISLETVLTRNPDVIIASGIGEEKPEWLADWQRYPALSATRHNDIYVVPPDIIQRHTVRILDGTERVCQALEQARQKR